MFLCNASKFSEDSLKSGTHYQCFSIPPGMALRNKYIYLQSALQNVSKIFFQVFDCAMSFAESQVIIFPCEDRQDKLPRVKLAMCSFQSPKLQHFTQTFTRNIFHGVFYSQTFHIQGNKTARVSRTTQL